MAKPTPAIDAGRRAGAEAILRALYVTVRDADQTDLSARQSSILLHTVLDEAPPTVRGLAERMNVSKPAVTRGLDRLAELELVKRNTDPQDRRSVLVMALPKGVALVAAMADALAAPAAQEG